MGAIAARFRMIAQCFGEWPRVQLACLDDGPANGSVFILDGIGGLLLLPVGVRKGLWAAGVPGAIEIHDWHSGPRGELLGDLIAYRRNLRKAAAFAEVLTERRRAYPDAPLHVVGFSGGAGLSVFALERLPDDVQLDTVILGCPALSPRYRLTAALRHVRRCVALISRRDCRVLGLGTTIFGTMDRRHGRAAGLVGFRRPTPFNPDDARAYEKLHQLHWDPSMRAADHFGNHIGCAAPPFAQHYLGPILLGRDDVRPRADSADD